MPQVPIKVPPRVTEMPPWIVSWSEKALPFVEPLAPMSSAPFATTPVTAEQLLRLRCSWPPKLQAVDDEQVASMFRSEEHTSELQSHVNLVCRLLLEKKKK